MSRRDKLLIDVLSGTPDKSSCFDSLGNLLTALGFDE